LGVPLGDLEKPSRGRRPFKYAPEAATSVRRGVTRSYFQRVKCRAWPFVSSFHIRNRHLRYKLTG
jgi:hypothetical protein